MVCILHHHPYMMCILHIRMMPYITSGKDQSCHQSVPLPLWALGVSHHFCFSGAGVGGVIPKRKMGWMPTHGCGNNTRTNSSRNIWLANLQSEKATILWNLSVNTVWESNMFHSNESEIKHQEFSTSEQRRTILVGPWKSVHEWGMTFSSHNDHKVTTHTFVLRTLYFLLHYLYFCFPPRIYTIYLQTFSFLRPHCHIKADPSNEAAFCFQ